MNWRSDSRAISIQISRDPANTTPATTGWLCAVCNSENPTDQSAQHGIALWRAGVDRDTDGPEGAKYLSQHYWTNAVMHGGSGNANELKAARVSCAPVLRDQIVALAPKVFV